MQEIFEVQDIKATCRGRLAAHQRAVSVSAILDDSEDFWTAAGHGKAHWGLVQGLVQRFMYDSMTLVLCGS